MYSYHINAPFLRLILHSTTVTTLDTNERQAVRTARTTRSAAHCTSVVSNRRLINYWRRQFNFSHSVPAGGKFSRWPQIFYVNPLAPSWAANLWKRHSKIAHQSRENSVKPYM